MSGTRPFFNKPNPPNPIASHLRTPNKLSVSAWGGVVCAWLFGGTAVLSGCLAPGFYPFCPIPNPSQSAYMVPQINLGDVSTLGDFGGIVKVPDTLTNLQNPPNSSNIY